jgi:5'-deoxynucleotidase YfbR-like HD superfamily hydrolase
MPEAYVGDTWTLNISEENRAKKELAESKAIIKLSRELPTHTADILVRYEKQQEPEARFVRFVDKVLPEVINYLAGNASTYKLDHSINSQAEMDELQQKLDKRYRMMFPEFDAIHLVHQQVINTFNKRLFK